MDLTVAEWYIKSAFHLAEQSDFTGLKLKILLQRYSPHAAGFKPMLCRY